MSPTPGPREHLVGELAVAARGARGPREAEALAPVLKELLNAEAGHTATTRVSSRWAAWTSRGGEEPLAQLRGR